MFHSEMLTKIELNVVKCSKIYLNPIISIDSNDPIDKFNCENIILLKSVKNPKSVQIDSI